MARQENLETIHRHNVVAERYGTLGDLRAELASGEHQRASPDDARVARGPGLSRRPRYPGSAFGRRRVRARSSIRRRRPKK